MWSNRYREKKNRDDARNNRYNEKKNRYSDNLADDDARNNRYREKNNRYSARTNRYREKNNRYNARSTVNIEVSRGAYYGYKSYVVEIQFSQRVKMQKKMFFVWKKKANCNGLLC